MLVYSYDKKTVIDVNCLKVDRSLDGVKDGKYVISGWKNAVSEGVVSRYATEEEAINGLENAFKAFADGAVYYIF